MKVAIMQPYFFPYIGYFSLIKNTERFILLDSIQYIRHGWIERNRILKPDEGWQYIGVPLNKHKRETSIKEIEISNESKWKEKIIAQLVHYKKIAPNYNKTIDFIKETFSKDYKSIVALNKDTLTAVCQYLGIEVTIDLFSEMNIEIDQVNAPDEWALNICKAIGGVQEYWNPEGGSSFFNINKYILNNINIRFLHQILIEYNQKRRIFEPGLSIIDVMMFNSPETISEMLTQYEIV
jgi:hypothetical protein